MSEKQFTEAEYNKFVDDLVVKHNKLKGIQFIPDPPHLLTTNEYIQPINNELVTEDLIRHFANATGDPNPLWRDPNYARGTRWGGIIAPPCFDYCIASCDGAGVNDKATFVAPGFNLFAGGNRHEYLGVIRPGDKFRIVDRYMGVEERPMKGKSYRMFVESGTRSYINQRDEVVIFATGRRVMTATVPGKASETEDQIYSGIKRHHFSREELDELYRIYDDQLAGKNRRGKEVLYWEDVAEGTEIPTIVKGPLDMSDACSAMLVEYNSSFAIKYAVMKAEIQNYPIDPETGNYRYRRDWHFEDLIARVMNVPYAFQIGKFSEMILCHVLTDWMGDDGFVKVLDCQLRSISIMGDMVWLKGKITRKYVENGEHLVDLNVWSENQDKRVIVKAKATVKLLSHEDKKY